MAQLFLQRSSHFHRGRNFGLHMGSALPLTLKFGRFFLLFSLTFLIGLISFFYLVKFTELHTKGYELRKLEIERDRLLTARELKTTDIAKSKSLNEIRGSASIARMIPVREAVFIKIDGSVANLPNLSGL